MLYRFCFAARLRVKSCNSMIRDPARLSEVSDWRVLVLYRETISPENSRSFEDQLKIIMSF